MHLFGLVKTQVEFSVEDKVSFDLLPLIVAFLFIEFVHFGHIVLNVQLCGICDSEPLIRVVLSSGIVLHSECLSRLA